LSWFVMDYLKVLYLDLLHRSADLRVHSKDDPSCPDIRQLRLY